MWEQIVNIPVPHGHDGWAGRGGLQHSSENRIQQRSVESNTLTFHFRVVEVFKALARDSFKCFIHAPAWCRG